MAQFFQTAPTVKPQADITTPTSPDSKVKTITKKMKTDTEKETGDKYTKFDPLSYIKIESFYFIKVSVGDSCVHIKVRLAAGKPTLTDIEVDQTTASPLKEF